MTLPAVRKRTWKGRELPVVTLEARVFSWFALLLAQPNARRVNYHNNYLARAFLQTLGSGSEYKWQGQGVRVPDYVPPYLRDCLHDWFPAQHGMDNHAYLQFYATGRLKVGYQSWTAEPDQIHWLIWRPYPRRETTAPSSF